jgi:sugar O-acyltransferase (sialic acid O-acetyltransferase NeuD family)
MQKIIIIGGGGHAKSVIGIIKKIRKYKIIGYCDIKNQGEILGIKYLGNDNQAVDIKKQSPGCDAAVGIGYVEISDARKKIIEKFQGWGFHFPAIISPTAIINEDVSIQDGVVIHDNVVINVCSKIGGFSIINNNVCIDHDCTIEEFCHICPGAVLSGGVYIGCHSIIGANSTIIHSQRIGPSCLIGAGAVVVNDCIKKGIYRGIPAKYEHELRFKGKS